MTDDPVIESVAAETYTVPADAPEADGTLAWDSGTLVLARVVAGGAEGVGWTYGSPACAGVITGLLADVIRGRPALDVPGQHEAMVRAVRNVTRQGVAGYAISAVDVALWDLKAKLLDLPLYRLLGAVRDRVPVYGSGGFTTYDRHQLRDQLTQWVTGQGIPRVKIKIGESWGTEPGRDLDRMRQARDIIGPGVELFVDANGGYGRKQAIRVMAAAADLDVRWFEEPVSSDDLEGLRGDPGRCLSRRDRRGVRLGPVLLPPYVRRRGRGLPASRRVPVRRHHRVAAGRSRGGLLRPADLRALRPPPARPRRRGRAQPPAS